MKSLIAVLLLALWCPPARAALKPDEAALAAQLFPKFNAASAEIAPGKAVTAITRKTSKSLLPGKSAAVVLAVIGDQDSCEIFVLDGDKVWADSGLRDLAPLDADSADCGPEGSPHDNSLGVVGSALDLAPYKLSATETAVGLRVSSSCEKYTIHGQTATYSQTDLLLFRPVAGKLGQVFAARVSYDDTDMSSEAGASPTSSDSGSYTLKILASKTGGMFDWQLNSGKKEVRRYHWDGAQYTAPPAPSPAPKAAR